MAFKKKITKKVQIGNWAIRPDLNQIQGSNGTYRIGQKNMELLLFLIRYEGNPVTKDEILSEVWDDVVVTEDSITKSISNLRQVFNSTNDEFPRIETIRGIGYQLVAPIDYERNSSEIEKRNRRQLMWALLVVLLGGSALSWYKGTSVNEDVQSGQPFNITNDWNQERVPRISPDGTKVMYAIGEEGWNNLNISVSSIETQKRTKVAVDDYLKTDPIWAPDGKQIAYFRNNGKEVYLVRKHLSSSVEDTLTKVKAIVNLSAMVWSTDGHSIIYCDFPEESNVAALFKINVTSLEKVQLTFPEDGIIGDLSPRLSPSGKQIAFIRAIRLSHMYYNLIPGEGTIYILDDEGNIEEILTTQHDISGISWIDESNIVYSVRHGNHTFHINQVDLTPREPRLLVKSDELIRNLDLHPKKNMLVYEAWNEHYGIWKYTGNPGSTNFTNRISKAQHNNWQPAFHESSGQLVYISTRTGNTELWLKKGLNEESVQLTNLRGPSIKHPQWSPDGDHIAFEVNRNDQDDIYTFNLTTHRIDSILTSAFEEKYPFWSSDSSYLYYSTNQSGQFEIWKKSLEGDKVPTQVTPHGGIRGQENNGVVYYTKLRDPGIWKTIPNGEERIIDNLAPYDRDNWTLAQGQLYYIRRTRFWAPQLYWYDVKNGTHEHYQSFTMQVSFAFSGIAMDPTNHTLMVTHNDRNRSDIKGLHYENTEPLVRSMSYTIEFQN